MGVLPDWMIRSRVKITPFEECQTRAGLITYGVTSYGYDARAGYNFRVFTNVWGNVVDPKNFNPKSFVEREVVDFVDIPPNSFALAETIEHFEIPRDILAVCVGKSTYARCGIIVNVTPLEPEWRGKVTVEISNTTPLPARIYAGEGIMQILFLETAGYGAVARSLTRQQTEDACCRVSYADKKGKYQDQAGVTPPKCD